LRFVSGTIIEDFRQEEAEQRSSCRCISGNQYLKEIFFYLENIPFQPPEIRRVMVIRIKGTDRPAGAAR
jgi:hypothetical protein